MKYLVSYDIASDRIRNKVSKILEDYGVRLQYSIFECDLSKKELSVLHNKLELLIKTKTDSLMFFLLCEKCYDKKVFLGMEYSVRRISVLNID